MTTRIVKSKEKLLLLFDDKKRYVKVDNDWYRCGTKAHFIPEMFNMFCGKSFAMSSNEEEKIASEDRCYDWHLKENGTWGFIEEWLEEPLNKRLDRILDL